MGEMVHGGCLGYSDHEIGEHIVLGDRRKRATVTLDMGKSDFMLLGELFGKFPRKAASEGIGVHQCWSLFKYHLLGAQEKAIPKCWKSSRQGRRPAWLNRDLLPELRLKKKVCGC